MARIAQGEEREVTTFYLLIVCRSLNAAEIGHDFQVNSISDAKAVVFPFLCLVDGTLNGAMGTSKPILSAAQRSLSLWRAAKSA